MKKRIIKSILALSLVLTLIACSERGIKDNEKIIENTEESSIVEDIDVNEGLKFSCIDINGETVSEDILKDKKLSLFNAFSTNCGPCMRELPELRDLSKELNDINIVLLDLDLDNKENSIASVKEQLSGDFGNLIIMFPDENIMSKKLADLMAIPYTFFLDENGNDLGDAIMGANSMDKWKSIIEERLK